MINHHPKKPHSRRKASKDAALAALASLYDAAGRVEANHGRHDDGTEIDSNDWVALRDVMMRVRCVLKKQGKEYLSVRAQRDLPEVRK